MDFSRIQDFDMQLLHVFNGSENVWLLRRAGHGFRFISSSSLS